MMYEEERTRILQMVADGTISPAQATDLLSALEPPAPAPPAPPRPVAPVAPVASLRAAPRRYLVIEISSGGGDTHVNLRIPLGLARAIGRFIPRQAQAYLNEHEINVQELVEGIGTTDESGTILEISDGGGDEHVRIAVE